MTCLAHARGARDNYIGFALRHEFDGVDRWDMTLTGDLSQLGMWRSTIGILIGKRLLAVTDIYL